MISMLEQVDTEISFIKILEFKFPEVDFKL